MATIKTMEQQVLRRLSRGDRPVGSSYHPLEIQAALKQELNTLLKIQYYNETLPTGETIPDGCILATYEGVVVTQWNGVSKSTLPAIPVQLPKNMGIFHVGKTTDAFTGFIPVKMGQMAQVRSQRLISDFLGQYAYTPMGKEIVYNKDLTTETPAINTVALRLIVSDFNKYTDYELLPINADQEKVVVDAVYNIFIIEPIKPEIASSVSEQG